MPRFKNLRLLPLRVECAYGFRLRLRCDYIQK